MQMIFPVHRSSLGRRQNAEGVRTLRGRGVKLARGQQFSFLKRLINRRSGVIEPDEGRERVRSGGASATPAANNGRLTRPACRRARAHARTRENEIIWSMRNY